MTWLPKPLTGGVVQTRSSTALREGELVNSSYVRLLPGNTDEVYPDWIYDVIGEPHRTTTVLLQKIVTFDDLAEPRILQVTTSSQTFQTSLRVIQFDGTQDTVLQVSGRATDATLVSRGAEYFVGTDQGNYVLDSGLEFREVGLDASELRLAVVRESTLSLGTGVFTDATFTMNELSWVSYRSLIESIYNQFGGSTQLANEMLRRFRAVLWSPESYNFLAAYMPIREIVLSAPGATALGGYWITEYYSDKAVESAPTEFSDAVLIEPSSLVLELKVDVQFALDNWDLIRDRVTSSNREAMTGSARESLRSWIAANSQDISVQLEVPDGLKEAIAKLRVSWTGNASSPNVDKLRLYRGTITQLPDFEFYWDPDSRVSTPFTRGGETTETAEYLESLADGLRVFSGGLLDELEVTEFSYDDDLRSSGIGNTVPAYPTVSYYDQGALGVYQYLSKPPAFVVAANMGQSLLFVTDDNRQVIRATPASDPENAPPIYAIPVVSRNQDKVVAIQTIRDFAVVFTTTATLRLNYLPFESSVSQDRVLSQISDYHGAINERLVTTVETQSGQMVVWLSRTGLMGTDGFGFRDMCPDFSVSAAGLDLDDANTWCLTNNFKDYRLELWVGGLRYDFYYHPTQLKDVRGDGLGLSFKLMGPTAYWVGRSVADADSGNYENKPVTVIGVLKDNLLTAMVSSETASDRNSYVTTGVLWGSNPVTALRTKAIGLKYAQAKDYELIQPKVLSYGIDGQQIVVSDEPLDVNRVTGFSYTTVADGLGEGVYYQMVFKGGPVGPLWLNLEEYGSGFGG